MEPIFNAKGEIVVSGLHPSVGNTQVPLWKDGSNVVFKDNSVKPGPFQSLLFNKPSGLLGNGIRSIDNEGLPAAVWGNRVALFRGTAVPTVVDATRLADIINDLNGDADDWSSSLTNFFNESTVVAPDSTGSLRLETAIFVGYGEGAMGEHPYGGPAPPVQFLRGWKNLEAGSTIFAGKTAQFWVRVNSAVHAKLSAADAVKIRFSSALNATADYNEYFITSATIPSANVWTQIQIDIDNTVADVVVGTPDLSAILSIMFTIQLTANAIVGDIAYLDEIGFAGAYTGTDLDKWSIVQFGQSVLASNGIDEVQYLADITTGQFKNLSTAGGDLPTSFRTKILQKLGPFIIAFNTDNDNTEARWCSEDNVLNWLPVARNSARDINLRDMNSSIKAAVEFGNSLLVIGNSRAHLFQFIGAPLFFGAKKLIDGIGAVGKNAVTEGGRLIYGFSENGIWLTDGTVKQYIDEPAIHTFIYEGDNKYDITRAELVSVWEDAKDDEIYFSYPTIDGFGFTASFNPMLQVWSMHDYWRTAASPGEHWNAPILLASTGDIFIQSVAGSGLAADVNPLGLSDEAELLVGYGAAAMGEQTYGGRQVF